MPRSFGFVLALSLTLGACTGSEKIDEKPAAEVQAPPPEPVKPPEVKGTPVNVDVATSKIEWLGAKVTRTHTGGFKSFEGSVLMDGENPVGADFTVDMASVFTDTDKLTEHIQSPDLFDVAQFAKAGFTSRDIKAQADGANTHVVTGELSMHGQKKVITFPAAITVAADKISVKADFKINRQDWGITYPGKPDDLIKDEVGLTLDLAFPRGGAAAEGAAPGGPAPTGAGVGSAPGGADGSKVNTAGPGAGVGKAPGAPEGSKVNTEGPGAGVGKAPQLPPAGNGGADAKKGGERK